MTQPVLSRRGYVRPTKRYPLAKQLAELEPWECDEIYVDDGKNGQDIGAVVRSLRHPGDMLVVPTLDRIAGSKRGLRPWLAQLREIGVIIVEASTGRRSDNPGDVEMMVLDAITRKGHDTETARRFGKMGGAKTKITQAQLAKAKKLWADSQITNDEIRRRTGISYRTLWRHLGARRVPAGRKPRQEG